jgi:SagB-type dehydrogenase family enzyme
MIQKRMTHVNMRELLLPSALYHENSKLYSHHIPTEEKILQISEQRMRQIVQAYKVYPNARQKIQLPKNFDNSNMFIEDVMKSRRSVRDFSGNPLTINQLSKLLYFTYGITGSQPAGKDIVQPLRAAPSAGALYPCEIYPVIFNIRDVEKGVYHYNVKDHLLEQLSPGDYWEKINYCVFKQEMLKIANLVFLVTAVFERNMWKYRERGYRYIFLDAGHLVQNAYLIAAAMEIGVCTVGGFLDDYLNDLLKIDGVHESVIYVAIIGNRK